MPPSKVGAPRAPLFGRPASATDPSASAAKSNSAFTSGQQGARAVSPKNAANAAQMSAGPVPNTSSGPPVRPPAVPPPGLPSSSLTNGFGKTSLQGAPQQPAFSLPPTSSQPPGMSAQPARHFAKPPVGGGEYVQQHQQPPPQLQAPAPIPSLRGGPQGFPGRPAFPQAGARGPPAFGKVTAGPSGGVGRVAPGAFGRPRSPGSPNSLYAIPMPASPTPSTSGRPLPPVQQPSTPQMPLPPGSGRGLAPPSFTKAQQAGTTLNRPLNQPSQSSAKIDPTQVPRPSGKGDAPEEYRTSGNQHPNPPPTQSHFVVRDTGNANPRFMRCTLSMLPYNSDLLKQSAMSLAVLVQPFALLDSADDQIQTVDFGESGPIRCSQCKAYMCPHMQFVDRGRKFKCCFCNGITPTPEDYVCNTGVDGRRHDADDRPELCRGSVEFVASREYMVRPPMHFVHFFLLEVSYNAVTSGALHATCSAIKRTLEELQDNDRVQVGIATFDTTVHFYSLAASQSQAQMLVMPDIDDVYSLASANVVVPLQASYHLVSSLLESLPNLFAQTQLADACAGAAAQACIDTLKDGVGGKLHLFVSSLPKLGIHGLTPRQAGPSNSSQQKQTALQPAHKGFQAMAEDAAEHQVSIDLFAVTRQYVDLASLGQLCEPTGGQLYHYYPFSSPADDDQLYNDLRWNLQRPQGMEAVARLRCSKGLTVERYLGSFHRRTATDIDLPAVNTDQSIAVQLRHEDKLDKEAFLQFVVLYSTTQGERRIRVHNLALPTSQLLGQVFKGADLDAQINLAARHISRQVPGNTLAGCQDQVLRHCINQLFSYRKNCTTAPSSGQLILPEALKLLPFYSLGLSKSPCLRLATVPDVRTAWMSRFLSLSMSKALPLMVPRLLPLHLMLRQANAGEAVQVPPSLALSSEKLQDDGVYLAENGYEGYIYFAQRVPTELVRALLGVDMVEGYSQGSSIPLTLPLLDNPLNQALHAVLDTVRQHRGAFMSITLLRRGDPAETLFYNCLVEDKNPAGMSYIEFLCAVHRQIQSMFK